MIQETLDGIVTVWHMDSLFAYEDLNMSKPHSLVRTVLYSSMKEHAMLDFISLVMTRFIKFRNFSLINLMWLILQCKMNIRDKVI